MNTKTTLFTISVLALGFGLCLLTTGCMDIPSDKEREQSTRATVEGFGGHYRCVIRRPLIDPMWLGDFDSATKADEYCKRVDALVQEGKPKS